VSGRTMTSRDLSAHGRAGTGLALLYVFLWSSAFVPSRVLSRMGQPLWVLTVRFASVDAYRRALSPFEVREHVVPLLSEARPEPSTFETLASAVDGHVSVQPSLLSDG